MLLHTLGKVPGSRGCVWGACDAQACLYASAYSHMWGPWQMRPERGPTPSWRLERAGAHVSTHAHSSPRAPRSPATRRAVTCTHRRAAGAGSRARADRGVRESAPPRDVRGAGAAPPARRSRPAAAAAASG